MSKTNLETGDMVPCPPEKSSKPFVTIMEDGFGFITDEDGNREIVRRYTLTNQNELTVQIITYGATITSIKYPDKNQIMDDVVLGYDTMEGYLSKTNPYFGAVVGRCANRINKGHFKLQHEDYQLSKNRGPHHLHGGFKGFDKVIWKSDIQGTKLVLSYLSKDGEEGYPGEVLVTAIYQLTTNNELTLEMKATCSRPTPVNLTNHSYFNLAGHATGAAGFYQHLVSINADKYTATDADSIPTGMLKNVGGTLWDLRIPRLVGDVIAFVPFGGYDQNLCIPRSQSECKTFVARVVHPESGRTLEVYSNQPGVQFYTANYFPKKEECEVGGEKAPVTNVSTDIKGKNGVHYFKHHAFCLETQNYPDAVNHPSVGWRRCPNCGYFIRDPEFENPDECLSETTTEDEPLPPSKDMILGKGGVEYNMHAGFCLMTQIFPDSVHRKNFPNCILNPGESYYHIVTYKFSLLDDTNLEPEERNAYESEWGGEGDQLEVVQKPPEDDLLEPKIEENGR